MGSGGEMRGSDGKNERSGGERITERDSLFCMAELLSSKERAERREKCRHDDIARAGKAGGVSGKCPVRRISDVQRAPCRSPGRIFIAPKQEIPF
jgi:hypothetical protein